MSELLINKLDAARRQLETAIDLYFREGDPVSIHTLAWASYDIIEGINKHRRGSPMLLKDELLQWFRPEYRKFWIETMVKHRNFFKHADKDPEAELSFNPELTDGVMFEACDKYRELTGENVPVHLVYLLWFVSHHKRLFQRQSPFVEWFDSIPSDMEGLSRKQYYEMAMSSSVLPLRILAEIKKLQKLAETPANVD